MTSSDISLAISKVGTFKGNTQFEKLSNGFGKVLKEFFIIVSIRSYPFLESFVLKLLVDANTTDVPGREYNQLATS